MVGDIETTFSQWINHNRDNKGKRPENGQNRRDLGGAKTNQQKEYLMFETTSQAQINTIHTKYFLYHYK